MNLKFLFPSIHFSSIIESKSSNNYCHSIVLSLEFQVDIMTKSKILVGYGVDIDAVAGWLGSYGGEDSTSDISRGISIFFSSCFPVPQCLALLVVSRDP